MRIDVVRVYLQIESYDGNGWRVERDLPNAAGRLGAAAFALI